VSPGLDHALVLGQQEVRLLDVDGGELWVYPHVAWGGQGRDGGCGWFDSGGQPWVFLPAEDQELCRIVALDLASGAEMAAATVRAAPAGVAPVHQPSGWVGLSEGEGQDAARTWWTRLTTGPWGSRVEVIDAEWDDWVLSDVNQDGSSVLTAPHEGGPLTVWSFPDLEVIRSVPTADEDRFWDFTACFIDDLIIGRLLGGTEETVAVTADGEIEAVRGDADWIAPGPHGTWFASTNDGTQLLRLRRGR
jgi:hypothetical protein